MRIVGIMFGVLFGLTFSGFGGFIAMQTAVPTYIDWQKMHSWEPHSATLFSASGSDNFTQAHYQYTWNGQEYENDRVYIASFNDNIGSYHKVLLQRLQESSRNNRPIQIWINPAAPQESVIDRDMRWGLFILMSGFCLVFILIGLGVMYACLTPTKAEFRPPSLLELRREYSKQKISGHMQQSFMQYYRDRVTELAQAAKQDKLEPENNIEWRERKGWERNGIRSNARKDSISIWFFALIWNAISWPVGFFMTEEIQKGEYLATIGYLFPLVGIFLLYKAIKTTREFHRYGYIEYEMDPYPGGIGGNVGGSLIINMPYHMTTQYHVTLECVNSYVSGSGDSESRKENIRWAEQGIAKAESNLEGVKVSFMFEIPENLPESSVNQTGDYFLWRLHLRANVKGADLDRTYNIPVFATSESSHRSYENISDQVQALKLQEAEDSRISIALGDFENTDLSKSMRIYNNPDGFKFYQPMFRHKFLALFAAIFGGGFSFACWGMLDMVGSSGLFGILIIIFMIPFALVAIIGNLATIYLLFNNLTFRIERGEVYITRRLFILPILTKKLAKREITRLNIERSGSYGQGTNKIEYYKIKVHYGTGKTITIAEGIHGEDLANQFKDYLFRKIQSGY